ncbi:thiamine pyrophosphate-binding protein [Streptomyces sp. NPDC005492]|uniref:thiamine pyrophosphate-binding protein n=1 Tax=Streptomyces sp. NPDC005492 TaxID=3156883 RepID=UPI00339E6C8A
MWREGVRHVFGVPGVQLDHVLEALARDRGSEGSITYIAARHEQGAAHMASRVPAVGRLLAVRA